MDLKAILNPTDKDPKSKPAASDNQNSQSTATASTSQSTNAVNDDSDTISDVSITSGAEEERVFTTPSQSHRDSSDTVPSTGPQIGKYAKDIDAPGILLSLGTSRLFKRRASASPTRDSALSLARRPRMDDCAMSLSPAVESSTEEFSIFITILKYPELTLEFAKKLDLEDLISLYAISKDFHDLVNKRFNAMITAQWHTKASESGRTFTHRCYKNLCMKDPALRINETQPDHIRFVPSFRWLRMVFFREATVDDIMRELTREGHRLPRRVTLSIKKLWFTMDISDNARRIGLMHNTQFWTNKDLFMATMFFLKLDMRLTNPGTGNGEIGLRKMLLGQRSLSTLARVLKREEMQTQLELLRMLVRYNYEPRRHREMSIMGVPPEDIGRMQYEGWGAANTKFIGLDDLVMREAIRRRLNLQNNYVDMMIYGYINKQEWTDIRTPMPAPPASDQSEDEDDTDDQNSVDGDKDDQRMEGLSKGE